MPVLFTADLDRSIVALGEAFEQKDFVGVVRRLAPCRTTADLPHIRSADLPIGERADVAPLVGGAYTIISDTEAEQLIALNADRAAAIEARQAEYDRAIAIIAAIPAAAQADLAAVNARAAKVAQVVNEGGEGFVPIYGWDGRTGWEILGRHGVDVAAVVAASAAINAYHAAEH